MRQGSLVQLSSTLSEVWAALLQGLYGSRCLDRRPDEIVLLELRAKDSRAKERVQVWWTDRLPEVQGCFYSYGQT